MGNQIQRATTLFTDYLTQLAAAGNTSGTLSGAVGFLVDQYEDLFQAGSAVSQTFRNITRDMGAQTPVIDEQATAFDRLLRGYTDFTAARAKEGVGFLVAPGATGLRLWAGAAGMAANAVRTAQVAGEFAAGGPLLPQPNHGDIRYPQVTLGDIGRGREGEGRRRGADLSGRPSQDQPTRRAGGAEACRRDREVAAGARGADRAEGARRCGTARHATRGDPAGDQVPSSQVGQLADQLMRARDMAQQTGRAIGESVTRELEQLVRTPAYRELFQRGLSNPTIGLGERSNESGLRNGGAFGNALDRALYGTVGLGGIGVEGATVGAIGGDASRFGRSIAGINVDLQAGLPALRNWREQVRGIAQSFGTLAHRRPVLRHGQPLVGDSPRVW